jgi:integrase
MGLYKRGKTWWMNYTVNGKQHCGSTKTSNKRLARKILERTLADIIEGRFRLPRVNTIQLKDFSKLFLDSIEHANTKKRYASSVANLLLHFGIVRLTDISAEGIEAFKDARLAKKVRSATVNRDLAVLRRMLNIAEKRRFILANPFREVEMLEERKQRRQPHILTFKEENRLLKAAPDHIRVLATLILETGLRSGREALALKWSDVDLENEVVRIKHSKSLAGIRCVPMSKRCKTELLTWRTRLGPEFSDYVFANPHKPTTHLQNVRTGWPKVLKAAALEPFWLYDLRHTFASRLTEAGVSPVFVAQIRGHSNIDILETYARVIDEFRRSAISKLETLRQIRQPEDHESGLPTLIQ